MKKNLIACVTCFSILVSTSLNIVQAKEIPNNQSNKIKRQYIDKTPFLNKIKEEDKKAGYSDFYKNFNINDKNYDKKFKNFANKLDKLNKEDGLKNTFDIKKINESKDLKSDSSISMGSSGGGTYSNPLNMSRVLDGSTLLVNNPGKHIQGSIQHCGMLDKAKFNNYSSKCILTAEPNQGVIYESPNHFRTFNESWALVYTANDTYDANQQAYAVRYARKFLGNTYFWGAAKSGDKLWYCSKVPYRAILDRCGTDIDTNGGTICLPSDILASHKMEITSYWN
ncbi:hypothetical protein P9J83_17445 [Clostridium sporogenes]|uniref:Uncharacterized protein n=1 Tax=Clostridium sporogenes TaxID=1509 RepID=A0AAE4FP88_CLOSG|nr:hypothetical protein [Clostridium sporogenes]MDS1005252.1 hypothetical protein [Clostridium sporogenes]